MPDEHHEAAVGAGDEHEYGIADDRNDESDGVGSHDRRQVLPCSL